MNARLDFAPATRRDKPIDVGVIQNAEEIERLSHGLYPHQHTSFAIHLSTSRCRSQLDQSTRLIALNFASRHRRTCELARLPQGVRAALSKGLKSSHLEIVHFYRENGCP